MGDDRTTPDEGWRRRHWARIKEILFEAQEKARKSGPPGWIEPAAGAGVLRDEVESLLSAGLSTAGLPDVPTVARIAGLSARVGPPDRIGPYRLLRKLGEGGMGEVWEAEQDEPVRRRVALKIIKAGMDSRQVLARFEAERQALALMSHANVARIHDGGATEQGRPFFVMELVKGFLSRSTALATGWPTGNDSSSSCRSATEPSTHTRRASSIAT